MFCLRDGLKSDTPAKDVIIIKRAMHFPSLRVRCAAAAELSWWCVLIRF